MARIALVGCADLPDPDHDEAPALEALRAAGHEAEAIAWDATASPRGGPGVDAGPDPSHDPAAFDLCVLRATWNYIHQPEAFLAWVVHATGVSAVWNPAPIVRRNHHKRYLTELASEGVRTVPSILLPRGTGVKLDRLVREAGWTERGWHGVVLKPAIGGWSWGVRAFPADLDAAQRDLEERGVEQDLIVQPVVPGYGEGRERSIVWIDHEVTHAVAKRPRLEGELESATLASPPTAAELELVEGCVAPLSQWLLYARIDVVPDADGEPMVSELELIEPSLYFFLHPPALEPFVRGVERRLG